MSWETLLSRLENVRQRGTDRAIARCPSHNDRGPSLSLRMHEDGRILVYCFAGCPASDIVTSVGMSLSDLFPERMPDHAYKPLRPGVSAADAINAMQHEVMVMAFIAEDISRGSTADYSQRAAEAASRIHFALRLAARGG